MADHATLAPSAATRWLACPGSIRLSAGIPDTPSIHADEGTFAHYVAERAIYAVAAADESHVTTAKIALEELLGLQSDCKRFEADREMLDHLFDYVEFCETALFDANTHWLEERVTAVPGDVWGTMDFGFVHDDVLEVDDLKYGQGVPVSPVENAQGMTYAVGALNLLREKHPSLYKRVDIVGIRIVQPRNVLGGGYWELAKAELEVWSAETLVPGVVATKDPDAPLHAGDHCKWCPAKATCPELRNASINHARDVFRDVGTLEVVDAVPSVAEFTPEQISKALAAAPMIQDWIAALHAHAYEQANAGAAIPGYKLVRKKSNRVFRDAAEAKTMLRALGVEPFKEPALVSPKQAEGQLDAFGKSILDIVVTKPHTGTVLVPDADKRKALNPADVFGPAT